MAPPTTQATTLDRQQWIQKYARHPNGVGEGDTFTMSDGSRWHCVKFRGRDRLYKQIE